MVLAPLLPLLAALLPAQAAPGQAGAVGVGVTERFGAHAASRSHLMAWLRPADPLFFGVGLGHATTRDTVAGVSIRASAAFDHELVDLQAFRILIEGGGVATFGAADSQLVSTVGPAARLVFLSGDDPISVSLGWSPEFQPGTHPSFEGAASELSFRAWF